MRTVVGKYVKSMLISPGDGNSRVYEAANPWIILHCWTHIGCPLMRPPSIFTLIELLTVVMHRIFEDPLVRNRFFSHTGIIKFVARAGVGESWYLCIVVAVKKKEKPPAVGSETIFIIPTSR
jgi:hypothetical protein